VAVKSVKADRRSKRTRQLLGSALVELMLEKRFDAITVQDILDRANIGRSTFYEHYTDKEDLLMSEIARVIHELEEYTSALGHAPGALVPSLEFFRHIQQQRRLIHAFVWGRSVEMLIKEFQVQLSKVVEQNLLSLSGVEVASSASLPLVARFVATTFLMLVQWWFENDLRHSPEQMDELFQKLVMPGVQAALGMKL
jgi:AcrR family transcriptional regulator